MRILLVVPRLISRPGKFVEFPLGLAYISAVLKKAGHVVEIINLNYVWRDLEELFSEIKSRFNPQLIGTGGLSPQYDAIRLVIDTASKVMPDVTRVVGGSFISGDPFLSFSIVNAHIGVIGEGEITMLELATRLDAGDSLDKLGDVAGLILRDEKGALYCTPPRPPLDDIDSLPFPDYEGFGFEEYIASQGANDGFYRYQFDSPRAGTVLTTRSCPLNCTFCFHPLGKKFRIRSLDSCFEEIEFLKNRYGINIVAIQDELFSANKDRILEFCKRIKPMNLQWNTTLRVKGLDEEILKTMKDSGCFCVSLGIESMNSDILKSMEKHITPQEIESAVTLTRKCGLNVCANLIFGDRAETEATADESLEWWKKHPEYGILLRFINPFPGCELYKYAIKKGIIKDPLEYLKNGCRIVNLTSMSNDDFIHLLSKVWSYHVNPKFHLKAQNVCASKESDNSSDSYHIDFKCPVCGEQNHYQSFDLTLNMIHSCLPVICCRKCNQKMLLFDYPKSACSENLRSLMEHDKSLSGFYQEWERLLSYKEKDWLSRMQDYLDPSLLTGRL